MKNTTTTTTENPPADVDLLLSVDDDDDDTTTTNGEVDETTTSNKNTNTNTTHTKKTKKTLQPFEITHTVQHLRQQQDERKKISDTTLSIKWCTHEIFMVTLFLIASMMIGFIMYTDEQRKHPPEQQLNYFTTVDHWSNLKIRDIQHWCLNPSNSKCSSTCLNPLTARHKIGYKTWEEAYYGNVREATMAALEGGSTDIVFLGDSITEGWKGFSHGRLNPKKRENIRVFEHLFSKNYGYRSAQLQALALGISGDKTYNLLWRIQNGEIHESLNPHVWWISIGRNDFGKGAHHCSPELVLMGIIRVVEEVRAAKPHALVVVNSLLPLSETKDGHLFPPKGSKHRSVYQAIIEVNTKLQDYCSHHHNLHYFDATSIFLEHQTGGKKDIINDLEQELANYFIPDTLMADYLNPTAEGYQLWGAAIVKEYMETLKKKRAQHEEKSETTTDQDRIITTGADMIDDDAFGIWLPPN